MCPVLAPGFQGFFFFFLLMQPLTVLTNQTRQAVHAIKQSIYLDVYGLAPWTYVLQLFSSQPTITNKLSRINQIHYWRSFCKRHEHYNYLQIIQIMKLETYLQKIIKRDQAWLSSGWVRRRTKTLIKWNNILKHFLLKCSFVFWKISFPILQIGQVS
jgi:hypothetical protein